MSLHFEDSITMVPKPDKDVIQNKLQDNITDEHRYKNLQQNLGTPNPTIH